MPKLPDVKVDVFNIGMVTRLEKDSVPRGGASDSLNWMTQGDRIELRRGQERIGDEQSGSDKVTGLKTASRFGGVKVLFKTSARSLHYFNDSETLSGGDDLWTENGTNLFPADASGEDIAIEEYHHISGAYIFAASPNSGIYQIPVANPGSAVDLSSSAHRGLIKIKQNRMFLWRRRDANLSEDRTGLYGSYIDKDELSDYTETTNENVGTGDGSEKTFSGTLAALSGTETIAYLRITDTVEIFTDDRDGVLSGDQGGTGTINYATGAFSVTFNTAPAGAQAITADYYTPDAKDNGIADFSKSATRTAGQGFVFRQDDGGAAFQNIGSIGDTEFCIHVEKTWRLTLSDDDTNATNLIYRKRVGIENWRAMVESGDGIYYIDSRDQAGPFVRLLRTSNFSTEVLPESISDNLNLSDYRFDLAAMFEWGEYQILFCRHKSSTVNDTAFFRHKVWGSWDLTDFRVTVPEEYRGALVGGDVASPNVFELFSGWTDEEANIPNHWISGEERMGSDGVTVVNLFEIAGLIVPDQDLEVRFSYDNGPFVLVGTIEGDGAYVDVGAKVTIGSPVLGRTEIGGGGSGSEASPFKREFRVNTDKFQQLRVRLEATKVGWVSVSEYSFKDIRLKGQSLPPKYVVN